MYQSQVKVCFPRGPLRWLPEQKNPKFLWSLQNAQHNTTNLAINESVLFTVFILDIKVNISSIKTAIVTGKMQCFFAGGPYHFFKILNSWCGLFKSHDPSRESAIFLSLFSPGNARFKFEHLQLFRQHCKQRLQFLGLFQTDMYRYREIPAEQVSTIFFFSNAFLSRAVKRSKNIAIFYYFEKV